MAEPRENSAARAMEAVIGWWREAGVDYAYSDDASGFLADPQPDAAEDAGRSQTPAPPKRKPEPAKLVVPTLGNSEEWPSTLDAFRAWWMSAPVLDGGATGGRLAPIGEAQPQLMVLVGQPEREDRDALLSGLDGKLLSAFLRAAGLDEQTVYRAAILPRHDHAPDWQARHAAGFAALAWRHIALVNPERLLVLGQNVRSILQHDPAQRDVGLRGLNQDGLEVPILAGMGLAAMRKAPRTKAKLWRDWLEWTGR